MNVYDFDGTIYYPDCAISFALWCMNRHPSLWFTFFPKALKSMIGHKLGKVPRYVMERTFFSFLCKVDDFDEQIEKFWDKHEKRVSAWYLAQKKPDDLIISASPKCIIEPIDQGFPEIENFYSDSLADTPMALCAEKAHLITDKAQKVNDWPKLDVETLKKVHEKIDSGWSVHL